MKLTANRGQLRLHTSILVFILTAVFYSDAAIAAQVVPIPGLFNTGVDEDGKKLGDKASEIHYDLSGRDSDTFVISDGSRPKAWTPSRGQSAWIGPENGTGAAAPGRYWYTLSFDLSGLDPSTAFISGAWATDNNSEIYLNNDQTGFEKDIFGFRELEYFELTDGFLHGKNTLQFWVNNEGRGPTGLLVSDLTGIAAEIPIPAAVWLLGSGLVAVIGLRRRIHN
jgi:hypothetical protein